MSGQYHVPAALAQKNNIFTRLTGDSVGLTADLDSSKKRKFSYPVGNTSRKQPLA